MQQVHIMGWIITITSIIYWVGKLIRDVYWHTGTCYEHVEYIYIMSYLIYYYILKRIDKIEFIISQCSLSEGSYFLYYYINKDETKTNAPL